jgi:hypothetical protein
MGKKARRHYKVEDIVVYNTKPPFLSNVTKSSMEVGEWFSVAKVDVVRVSQAAGIHLGRGNWTCRRAESNNTEASYILQKTGTGE